MKTYLDMTFGHSAAILESNPLSKIYALDRDPIAIEFAHQLNLKYP